jgi:menaquinone-specific isochorismate synthase
MPFSLSFKVEEIDILGWLKHQELYPRVYWANRNGNLETGGYGTAMTVVASETSVMDDKLRKIEVILRHTGADTQLKFIGGRCFDNSLPDDQIWSDFPPLWFTLPKLSITRDKNDYILTVATAVTADTTNTILLEEIKRVLDTVSLEIPSREGEQVPEILSRQDHPNLAGWTENVNRSLHEIDRGNLEKIVLARRTDMTFSGKADPYYLLSRLRKKNRNCFAFLFEPRPGKAFVGVTPERFFKVEGEDIFSEAISGTTARGEFNREGDSSENDALYSEKNLLEHQYVLDDIARRIEELCEEIHSPEERTTFELSNVLHIYSGISGRLKDNVSLSEIISSLHPTPAVGGTPREKALPLVRELEPFTRGWYASPVGIIGQNHAEMAVAIRSVIVEDDRVSLFAGAGIVSGSAPETEWQELEQKISHAIEGLSGVLL